MEVESSRTFQRHLLCLSRGCIRIDNSDVRGSEDNADEGEEQLGREIDERH